MPQEPRPASTHSSSPSSYGTSAACPDLALDPDSADCPGTGDLRSLPPLEGPGRGSGHGQEALCLPGLSNTAGLASRGWGTADGSDQASVLGPGPGPGTLPFPADRCVKGPRLWAEGRGMVGRCPLLSPRVWLLCPVSSFCSPSLPPGGWTATDGGMEGPDVMAGEGTDLPPAPTNSLLAPQQTSTSQASLVCCRRH